MIVKLRQGCHEYSTFKEGRTEKETLSYMVSANISLKKNILTVITYNI